MVQDPSVASAIYFLVAFYLTRAKDDKQICTHTFRNPLPNLRRVNAVSPLSGLATMLTTHIGFWASPAIHVSRSLSVSQSPEGLGYPDLSWTSNSQIKEKELEPQT